MKEASEYTQDPVLPRQKRIPRRLDGASSHTYSSPEEYYRQQYYQVLDLLTQEMDRRFDQPTFLLLQEMERLLVDSSNGISVNPSSTFKELYASDLNMDKLMLQLAMLPDVIATANNDCQMRIKRVTTVQTVCELFNTCQFPKTMLAEVDQLLRIYLTVPLTSATAERSFSTLRRLKSYLRSTMTQKRLNHVMLLHTHKENFDDLNLHQIAQDFASRNNRRVQFFGKF